MCSERACPSGLESDFAQAIDSPARTFRSEQIPDPPPRARIERIAAETRENHGMTQRRRARVAALMEPAKGSLLGGRRMDGPLSEVQERDGVVAVNPLDLEAKLIRRSANQLALIASRVGELPADCGYWRASAPARQDTRSECGDRCRVEAPAQENGDAVEPCDAPPDASVQMLCKLLDILLPVGVFDSSPWRRAGEPTAVQHSDLQDDHLAREQRLHLLEKSIGAGELLEAKNSARRRVESGSAPRDGSRAVWSLDEATRRPPSQVYAR